MTISNSHRVYQGHIHACMHAYMEGHEYTFSKGRYIHTYIHTYMGMNILLARADTHTHTHTHIYIHTYIHRGYSLYITLIFIMGTHIHTYMHYRYIYISVT